VEDQRLVRLAQDYGYLTAAQVAKAERERQALADRGVERSLWFMLMDLELITDRQARDLRKHVSSSTVRALEVEGHVFQGRIGSGGMGDVFRARNAQGQEVAVKLLAARYAHSDESLRRFQREARAGMRLQHPNIVRSLSAGETDGNHYLIMELVEGQSLKARLGEGSRISEDEALNVLVQIADALSYAWAQGVLHRDVKPANIVLGAPRPGTDEPFCAKLCDFGLAKVWQRREDDSIGQLTGPNLALGTPHYMSPEQAAGESDLDQRCDVYGLGASIYHCLLGHTMFAGKSSAVIMYKQVTETVDLSQLTSALASPGFKDLLTRMLHKDRDKRIADWAEVQRTARDLLGRRQSQRIALPVLRPTPGISGSRIHPALAGAIERAGSATKRRRWLPAAVVAGAILAGALVAWTALKLLA